MLELPMPPLNKKEKKILGNPISPFEQSEKALRRRKVRVGESHRDEFEHLIHDAVDDGKPKHRYEELTVAEIDRYLRNGEGRYKKKCFLWILDEVSIKIIREATPNARRKYDPEHVCHTNLTAGGKAYAGGEMFFGVDGKVYINPFSDRYGGRRFTEEQWASILNYFRRVGYKDVVDILDLLPKK